VLHSGSQDLLLDLFGRAGGALAGYQETYQAWRALVVERERIAHETKLAPEQIAFLQNQLTRMEGLELTMEAIEALESSGELEKITQRWMSQAAGAPDLG